MSLPLELKTFLVDRPILLHPPPQALCRSNERGRPQGGAGRTPGYPEGGGDTWGGGDGPPSTAVTEAKIRLK